ncbi:MAG: hypothetical protein DRO52_02040 [Candidatus Hecatellales archaeon]|nr:MAG: hypothetical protein DRO52_02040 [Candidatus Hecatellales archaeon]
MSVEGVITQIPVSTLLILGLTVILALSSSLLQRKMVDIERVKEVRGKLDELRRQLGEAKKRGDKKAVMKLQRKQMILMRESSSVLSQQFKASFTLMIPFLILYWALIYVFGQTPVAVSPIPFPWGAVSEDGLQLSFWVWYLLSALAVNLPITRLLGIHYS